MEQKKARIPPVISLVKMSDAAKMLNLDKRKYIQKVQVMKEKRRDYETRWKAIRDYQLPYVGNFDDTADSTNEARRRDTEIYHSVAWESNQVFAAGIMSGLTPPSRQWFRLSFANQEIADDADVSRLLDERMDILNHVLNSSNFYNSVHANYLELAFGQAPLAIFPDSKTGVHFTPFTIGTYMMESGSDGMINTFCRVCEMTSRQLADKFGEENLTGSIRNELANGTGMKDRHKVYWLVEPNRMADKERLDRFHMPYLSIYWLEESNIDEWLYIGGFHEWPVPVARYLITGNEAYGKGPGWFAEGDSKGLQLLEKDDITAVELGIKPPMMASEDTAKQGVNLVPGDCTIVEKENAVKPLFQVQVNLAHLQEKISDLESRIKRSYSADLFLMLDQLQDKSMTAREVMERTQEKMQQLGPVVQRMQFEFLNLIIERTYNVLDRAGVFPVPEDPDLQQMLSSQEIKIEYISPLAQAQKLSGLVNIEQAVAFVAQLAQFDSSVLDKVDFPKTVDRYFDMLGAPATIKRSDDEYQKIQQAKQEKQAQQEQLQQAAMIAQAAAPAAQAAKNATEAANDGNPGLRQWMGLDELGQGQGGSTE